MIHDFLCGRPHNCDSAGDKLPILIGLMVPRIFQVGLVDYDVEDSDEEEEDSSAKRAAGQEDGAPAEKRPKLE